MTTTIIDSLTLVGAATSPWGLLKNATVKFTRVLSDAIDPSTGSIIPGDIETLVVPVYFKKTDLVRDDGRGVPVGTYRVRGYTVGILPDWAKQPSAARLPCVVDFLGSGYFHFDGKIHVVAEQVEQAGKGSQIQGYFTMEGSGI